MAKLNWDPKDPDEVDDRAIVWDARLPSTDSITSSSWDASPSGLTLSPQSTVDKTTRVMISGGADGTKYAIRNRIETDEGRTLDQTVYMKVKSR